MQEPVKPEKQREELLTSLYLEAFPLTAAMVQKNGGSIDDARELFQQAVVIFYEQVLTQHKAVHTSHSAYLQGIARHLWYQYHKSQDKLQPLEGIDLKEEQQESVASNKLLHFLEMAGKRCMDMLKAFYYDKTDLKEIAGNFGFSGTRSATVQKYKCLEKVRTLVKEKELTYADFTE